MTKGKDRQIIIKRGKHTFIHEKSPMTMIDAAKAMLEIIDIDHEEIKIRKIRRKKK